MGESAHVSAINSARAFRAEGRPDLAAAVLERDADLANAKADLMYLRALVDLDDRAPLQAALIGSVDRIVDQARLPADYLQLLLRQTQRACLSEDWLERLLRKSWKSAKSMPEIMIAHRAASRRLLLRRRMRARATPKASLISLGLNCMPWNVPNQWGLRRAEDFVALHGPFDHGAHKLALLLSALETDFATYCAPENLTSVETQGGHVTPMRKDVMAVWNHNLGSYWIADDFLRLRQSLTARAETFRTACRRQDVVFIMGRAPIDYPARPPEFLDRLNLALQRFTGQARNRLVILDEYAQSAACEWIDEWTLVLNCPYPKSNYVWYEDETADTAEGLEYEHGWAMQVMHALIRWGLTSPGEAFPAPVAAVA